MSKLIVYDNGESLLVSRVLTITFTDKEIVKQIDTTKATPEEIDQLRKNPNDDILIAKIKQRG